MRNYRTAYTITSNSSHQAVNPIGVLLRLAHDDRVTLLENLVYRDEGLECLDLVGENGLPAIGDSWSAIPSLGHIIVSSNDVHFHAGPESRRRLMVPCVDNAASHMFPCK